MTPRKQRSYVEAGRRGASKPMRRIINARDDRTTAREVMQKIIHEEGSELPVPRWIKTQRPPRNSNDYSDGSLKTLLGTTGP